MVAGEKSKKKRQDNIQLIIVPANKRGSWQVMYKHHYQQTTSTPRKKNKIKTHLESIVERTSVVYIMFCWKRSHGHLYGFFFLLSLLQTGRLFCLQPYSNGIFSPSFFQHDSWENDKENNVNLRRKEYLETICKPLQDLETCRALYWQVRLLVTPPSSERGGF